MDANQPYLAAWGDPPWLTDSVDAQQALETLEAKGRDRLWLIGYLVLLRRDYERRVKLRTLRAAAKRFNLAAKKVLDAIPSLLPNIERIIEPEDATEVRAAEQRLDVPTGSLQLGLDQVPLHLEAVKLTLERELPLIERNAMRQHLKALLVCEARGPDRQHFYDMEVSALINAATADFSKDTYSADAHKDWRARHKKLIQRGIPQDLPPDITFLFDEVWELRSERNLVEFFEDLVETARWEEEAWQEHEAKEREAEEMQAAQDELDDVAHIPRE